MKQNIKPILDELDNANIAKVFELIDIYQEKQPLQGDNPTLFNQLKQEFMIGRHGADYIARLRVFIHSNLISKNNELTRKNEQEISEHLQKQIELEIKPVIKEKAEKERTEKFEIEKLQKENNTLKLNITQQQNEITSLSTLNRELSDKNTLLLEGLKNKENYINELQKENNAFKLSIKQQQNEINKLISDIKKLEVEQVKLKSNEEKALKNFKLHLDEQKESWVTALEQERNNFKSILEQERTNYNKILNENRISEQSIEDLKSTITTYEHKVDTLKGEVQRLETNKTSLSRQIKMMPKEIEAVREELITLNKEKSNINNLILKRIDEYNDRIYSIRGFEYIVKKAEKSNVSVDNVCNEYRKLIEAYLTSSQYLASNFSDWQHRTNTMEPIFTGLLKVFQNNQASLLGLNLGSRSSKEDLKTLSVHIQELTKIISDVKQHIGKLHSVVYKVAEIFGVKH